MSGHEINATRSSGILKWRFREVLRQLREDGWEIVRTRGSHRQLKHPTKPGLVTVSGKPNVDIPPGTLKSIWRQAQLED